MLKNIKDIQYGIMSKTMWLTNKARLASLLSIIIVIILLLSYLSTPALASQKIFQPIKTLSNHVWSGSGSGSSGDPYQITTVAQLQEVGNYLNQTNPYFKVMNDIDCSDTVNWNSGAGFAPIGYDNTDTHGFRGHFNGDNKEISDLYISRSATDYIGLFGGTYSADISNVNLVDCNITGHSYTGGLIGMSFESVVTSCEVSSGSVTGYNYVGGFIGYTRGDTSKSITSSGASCTVGGHDNVGGFIGASPGKVAIDSCYSSSVVTSDGNYTGGFIGQTTGTGSYLTTVTESYSSGSVSQTGYYMGGFIGLAAYVTVTDCYSSSSVYSTHDSKAGFLSKAIGTVDMTNCYSTGSVNGSDTNIAGFVYGEAGTGNSATSCFWDTTTSGQSTSYFGTGYDTATMQTMSTYTDASWSINTIALHTTETWKMADGSGYPLLSYQSNPTPFTVSTQNPTSVSFSSMTGNGTIVDTGGSNATERGFCYIEGSTGDPTTSDSIVYDTGDFGAGSFSKSITGLSASTSYRVRAYAINPSGTTYGTTITQDTTDGHPIITLNSASSVTRTTATLNASLTDLGDNSGVDVYFEWGYTTDHSATTPSYDYSTTPTHYTSVPQSVAHNLTSLVPNSKIYFKVVADGDTYDTTSSASYFFTLTPPVTIAEDTFVNRQGSITHAFQRKGFVAQDRYWLVYMDSCAEGFFYSSSDDGTNWDDPVFILNGETGLSWPNYPIEGSNESDELNVTFDGTYAHFVYVWNRNIPDALEPGASSNNIWYRRGVPNSDGTITWSSDWTVALARNNTTVKGYASITTDTDGYPWISYWESAGIYTYENSNYATPDGTWNEMVIKSTTKDGSFTASTPYELKHNAQYRATGALVQLTEDKLYWVGIGEIQSPKVIGRLWNGSSWGNEETISTDAYGVYRFSLVQYGDVVQLAWLSNDKAKIYHATRTESGWSTPITIVSGIPTTYASSLTLSVNRVTGDLYLFYPDYDENHIYYCEFDYAEGEWGEPIDFVDESFQGIAKDYLSTHLGSYQDIRNGKLGIYYVRAYHDWIYGTDAAYMDIEFAYLFFGTIALMQTDEATSVNKTTATLNGQILDTGGETANLRGFCYKAGTSGDPTTDDSVIYDDAGGYGIGSYSKNLTGLSEGTAYRARAYSINSAGTSYGDTVSFNTLCDPPTVTTSAGTSITYNSFLGNGNITATGGQNPFRRGFCYMEGSSGDPTVSDSVAYDDGDWGIGTFSKSISDLASSTSYRVRAYAINEGGGIGYGTSVTVNTYAPILPTVTTQSCSLITATSSICHGTITDIGSKIVTTRGICYSITSSPTISDDKVQENGTFEIGAFSKSISNLSPGTVYYVRAFATNAIGTSYGDSITILTKSVAPISAGVDIANTVIPIIAVVIIVMLIIAALSSSLSLAIVILLAIAIMIGLAFLAPIAIGLGGL